MNHIDSLDGIRGIAISLVLFDHLFWSNTQTGSRILNFIVEIRGAGWVGVDLFFALSGFLITGILFDTLQTRRYFKNFYARRFLRIFPIYYGTLLVLLVVFRLAHIHQGRQFLLLFTYLQNTPLWFRGLQTGFAEATSHLWSLAVEEQFYLVWPVLVFLIRDRRKLLWTAAGLAFLAPCTRFFLLDHGAPFSTTYTLTICRADSLLAGAWLALIVRGNLRDLVLRRYALPVFALALSICGLIAWKYDGFDWEVTRAINSYGYTVVAVASTALIAMALTPTSLTAKAMRVGALRFLGKYSYGIYIYHSIILALVGGWLRNFLERQIASKAVFHIAFAACLLLITIPIALVSYHFYERPFLRLKRYFSDAPPLKEQTALSNTADAPVQETTVEVKL